MLDGSTPNSRTVWISDLLAQSNPVPKAASSLSNIGSLLHLTATQYKVKNKNVKLNIINSIKNPILQFIHLIYHKMAQLEVNEFSSEDLDDKFLQDRQQRKHYHFRSHNCPCQETLREISKLLQPITC